MTITFPSPAGYLFEPWPDPNGKRWIADSKGRWSEFVEPVDISGLLTISTAASTYAPISHTQAVSTISDSTTLGRSLVTAASADAALTSLGAGAEGKLLLACATSSAALTELGAGAEGVLLLATATQAAALTELGLFQAVSLGAATLSSGVVESPAGTFTCTSVAVGNIMTYNDCPALVNGAVYLMLYEISTYTSGSVLPYFSGSGGRFLTSISQNNHAGHHGGIGVFSGTIAADPFIRAQSIFTGVIRNVRLIRVF